MLLSPTFRLIGNYLGHLAGIFRATSSTHHTCVHVNISNHAAAPRVRGPCLQVMKLPSLPDE